MRNAQLVSKHDMLWVMYVGLYRNVRSVVITAKHLNLTPKTTQNNQNLIKII